MVMGLLHLIIAESELELVPPELAEHPLIKKSASRRGKSSGDILLDANLHHSAMFGLEDADRRGRPDIVHVCLLYLLDSRLSRKGMLRVYVHTRNDEIIFINPETRIPRNYNRFCGLMEKLLKEEKIEADGLILLERSKGSVKTLVGEISPDLVYQLHEKGDRRDIYESLCKAREPCVIIGGFPHGDFEGDYSCAEAVAVYEKTLNAWTVACEVVSTYYGCKHGKL